MRIGWNEERDVMDVNANVDVVSDGVGAGEGEGEGEGAGEGVDMIEQECCELEMETADPEALSLNFRLYL